MLWSLVLVVGTDPTIDLLSKAGPAAILAFIVVAFIRGWIVTGAQAKELRDQRDRALDLVYKQAEITHRALEAGENK